MKIPPHWPTSVADTVRALWRSGRIRHAGRARRQAELMNSKGAGGDFLGCLGAWMIALAMLALHALYGFAAHNIMDLVSEVSAERSGTMTVNRYDWESLQKLSAPKDDESGLDDNRLERFVTNVASNRVRDWGGDRESEAVRVRQHFDQTGIDGFIYLNHSSSLPKNPLTLPPIYWGVLTVLLSIWFIAMIFGGEGLELDVQRARHPMWEWIMSHPVRPVAAFSAEMLTPAMTNPLYFTSPLFWLAFFGSLHGTASGIMAAVVVGIPFAFAASAMNKAFEIVAMLRLPQRSRGAFLGLMSWAGYVALMGSLLLFSAFNVHLRLVAWLAELGTLVPGWPIRMLLYGWGESPKLWQALLSGVVTSTALFSVASAVAWWGLKRGLQAPAQKSRAAMKHSNRAGWLDRYPLYKKELLWFWRDKGAVVQVFLVPLTIAAMQSFNLRGLAELGGSHWNVWCGIAVICGTYFLVVLGPRSLASEGAALWIPLTWPEGLDDLLTTKARLWWFISSGIVGLLLFAACFVFPGDIPRILLVALGWLIFSFSLSEKAVTLVTAPTSSGEMERPPRSRQWAIMLGTFAFGTGVMTGNWHLAVIGVVYSSLTAAAMWQNLRARLPHLFDPWSEKLPPAPSVMHAVIAITVVVEAVGIGTVILSFVVGVDHLWTARAMAYAALAGIGSLCVQEFLSSRGVTSHQVWNWPREGRVTIASRAYLEAIVLGTFLGGLALLYVIFLQWLPFTGFSAGDLPRTPEIFSEEFFMYALLAIGLAPFAEEYLFRGILYRALDREWSERKAMVGSAAFFAIYHPPVSWIPVFLLGLLCAWLFRRKGSLHAPILAHMSYNAVIVFGT